MNTSTPYPRDEAVVSVGVGVILTILTCGIYGLYWQAKQMWALNAWLGREDFNFLTWLLLGIVTCGIFMVYYEYKMAKAINEVQEARRLAREQRPGVDLPLDDALWPGSRVACHPAGRHQQLLR